VRPREVLAKQAAKKYGNASGDKLFSENSAFGEPAITISPLPIPRAYEVSKRGDMRTGQPLYRSDAKLDRSNASTTCN
jgi:hypothetical protein